MFISTFSSDLWLILKHPTYFQFCIFLLLRCFLNIELLAEISQQNVQCVFKYNGDVLCFSPAKWLIAGSCNKGQMAIQLYLHPIEMNK